MNAWHESQRNDVMATRKLLESIMKWCAYFMEFTVWFQKYQKWHAIYALYSMHLSPTWPFIWSILPMLGLTHWGRVTHICVGNLTIIGPDNGLSPDRRQAIIWTNAGILLIGPWGTNFSEISIDIHTFSFKKINLKMASAKWRPFCLGLNVLTQWPLEQPSIWFNKHLTFGGCYL